jgi:hypothetical protein
MLCGVVLVLFTGRCRGWARQPGDHAIAARRSPWLLALPRHLQWPVSWIRHDTTCSQSMSSAASLDSSLAGLVLRCGHAPTAPSIKCYGPRPETCRPGPSCRAPVADASWQSQLGSSCGSARATTSGLLLQCHYGAGHCSCSPKAVHAGLCSLPSRRHVKHACHAGSMEGGWEAAVREQSSPCWPMRTRPARTNREAANDAPPVLQPPCPQAVGRWRAAVVVAPRRASLQTPSCSSLDSCQASIPQGHTSYSASTPRRATVGVLQCCCCGVG